MAECSLIQGASRGIGHALVRTLLAKAEVGTVYATCRDPENAGALCALSDDPRLVVLPLDVTRESTIEAAAAAVRAGNGRLDRIVNVAGILHDESGVAPEKRLDAISGDALQKVFAVNAFGPLLVMKHFHQLLRHDGRAVLANVSARVGSITDNRLGGWYGYRGSKAALNMFTRTAVIELARRAPNAIVVAIHPGTVDTEMSRPFQRGIPAEKLFDTDRAAAQILNVLASLEPEQSGSFLAWDGSAIPW
ncbi:MAG: SDR family oxidoreductase [Candidatus Binatia bacterium]|nr:SDR family oxidoreductase [Candidatus Binatia bacterium]